MLNIKDCLNRGYLVKGETGQYEVTEQGLAHGVEKLCGGQPIVNLSAALLEQLEDEGTFAYDGKQIINSAGLFIVYSVILYVVKQFADRFQDDPKWKAMVIELEDKVLSSTAFFARNPRAYGVTETDGTENAS